VVNAISAMSPESAKAVVNAISAMSPESAKAVVNAISAMSPESAKAVVNAISAMSPESAKIAVQTIAKLTLVKVFAEFATANIEVNDMAAVELWDTVFYSMLDEKKQMIPSNLPIVTEFSNEKVKMIGEIRLTKDTNKLIHQMAQLQTFKNRGYNWALYSITTESVADIPQAISIMESARLIGLKVCLAYSRSEYNRSTLYTTSPAGLKEILSKLGAHADSFLPMWRGSSPAHTTSAETAGALDPFDLSMALIGRWTSEAIREANPNLPIWGTVEFFKVAAGWSPPYCSNTLVVQVANSTKNGFFPGVEVKEAVNSVTTNMRKDRPIIIGPIFYPHAYWKHRNSLGVTTISEVDKNTDAIVMRVAESLGGALRLAGDGYGLNDGLADSNW